MIYHRRVCRETLDMSYDGRNGFPTITEAVFEIVETATVFDQEVSRVLATATDSTIALRIVNALKSYRGY
jgi:hypothetical protein